jgi:ComF family protein
MLTTLSRSILTIAFPQACGICQGEVESHSDGIVCSECWNATRLFEGKETLCIKCGAFLFERPSSRHMRCRKCDEHLYDFAYSVGVYEKALSTSVLRLKRVPHLAGRLGELTTKRLDQIPVFNTSVVIPVPLSERRRRERGFNQASIVANVVARHIGVPMDEISLIRKVHTPLHRAGMDRKARATTVKNAFEVVRPKLTVRQHVLLVDDVLTSGETVSMCAKVLKKNGAATVNVFTIARAL